MADMEANTVMATQAQELVDASAGDVARGVGTGQHANVEVGTNCNASSFGSSDNNSFSQTGAAPTVTLGVDAKHLSDALDAMSKRIMTESQRLQAKEAAADEKLASALAVAAGCAVSQSQVAAEKARVEQLAADLQAEAEHFRREREALEVVVSDARSRRQEAEEREAAYRRRCEDAEGRYSGVEAAARAAAARVAELEEALAKETTERQSMADKLQETSLLLDGETKAKESAESRARKAEDTSAQAEAAVAILRSEVSRLETAVLELELKLRDAYRNAEAERNDAASARSSLEAELLKSRASAAGFKSRCDELEVSLASSTAECKSKAGELKEAKKQLERMKSAWEKDKKKLDLIKSLTSTLSDMHSAPVDAALPPSPTPMLTTPGAGAGASSTSPASSSPAQSPRGQMHSPTSAVSSPAAAPVVTATAASNGVISGGNDEMAVEAHSSEGALLQGAGGASAEAGGAAVVPTVASPPRLQHGAATTAANSGSSSKKLATRSSITAAFQPSSPSAGLDEPATTGGDASASVDVGACGDACGVDGSAPARQEAASHVGTALVPSTSGTKRKRSLSADEVGEGEDDRSNAAAPRVGEASADDDASQPRAAKTIALGIDAAGRDNAGKNDVGDIEERRKSEAAAEESASSSAEQAQGAEGGNGSSAKGLALGEAAGDEVAGALMQDQQDRQPDEVVMSSESAAPSASSSMLPAAALAAQQCSVQAADGGGGGSSIMFEDAQRQEDGISPVPASLAAAQLSAAVAVAGDAAVPVLAAGGAASSSAAEEGCASEEPCLDPHHPIDDHAAAEGRMAVDEDAAPNEVAADGAVAVAASQQQQSHINAFEPAVFSGSVPALPAPVGPPPAAMELVNAAASPASGPDGDVVMQQQQQQQLEEHKGPDVDAPLSLPRASSSPAKPVPSAVQAPASTAPAAAPSPLPPQGSLPSSSTAPRVKHTVATEEPHRPSPNIIPAAAAAATGPQSSAVDAEAHLVRLPKDFMASIAATAVSSSSTRGAAGVQKTIRDIKNSYSIDAANGEVGIALSSGVHKDLGKGGNSVGRNKVRRGASMRRQGVQRPRGTVIPAVVTLTFSTLQFCLCVFSLAVGLPYIHVHSYCRRTAWLTRRCLASKSSSFCRSLALLLLLLLLLFSRSRVDMPASRILPPLPPPTPPPSQSCRNRHQRTSLGSPTSASTPSTCCGTTPLPTPGGVNSKPWTAIRTSLRRRHQRQARHQDQRPSQWYRRLAMNCGMATSSSSCWCRPVAALEIQSPLSAMPMAPRS